MNETLGGSRSRRAGLGRRVADIVSFADLDDSESEALLGGPSVVPLDVVPWALLVLDDSGSALMTNRRWSELSGLSAEESLERGWLRAVDHQGRCRLLSELLAGAPYGLSVIQGRAVRWARAAEAGAGQTLIGLGMFALDEAGPPSETTGHENAATGGPADPVLRELGGLVAEANRLVEALTDPRVLGLIQAL